ncbi:MAG TPA: molybdate ABC transporter substrate-binding protein [Actinomycetota bacterium]|nr:molybdate ABC transporter substrate-binding protein [Actinomycetota bacterium]
MRRSLSMFVGLVGLATACSFGEPSSSPSTTLTVFAASSLAVAFDQIGRDFEAANPGVQVDFNFGSSTDLAAQIASEGTADVFASANPLAMDAVATDPGVSDRTDFATNSLVIITPPDNPAQVLSLDNLTSPQVQIVIGAEGVPVGDYARQMLRDEGIDHAVLTNVVSNEPDDASVVARVVRGEADAGIVYVSDAHAAGASVMTVAIPPEVNVTATYPIAIAASAQQATVAATFLAWVRGPAGQAVLRAQGFGPPPDGG